MNHASIALVVVGRCLFASARVMLLIGQHPILQYFVIYRQHLQQILHAPVFFFGSDRFTVLAGKMMFRATAFAKCYYSIDFACRSS